MRRHLLFFLFITVLFSLDSTIGQTLYYSGNLLRIPFGSTQSNPTDTIGYWFHRSFDSSTIHSFFYEKYFDHITTFQNSYFLKKIENFSQSPYMEWNDGGRWIVNEGSLKKREYSGLATLGMDIPESYMLTGTIVTGTKKGLWLINGIFGNAFLTNSDSLLLFTTNPDNTQNSKIFNPIKTILGKINEKLVVAVEDNHLSSYYNYYLIDPDNSPIIDSSNSAKINFSGDSTLNYNPRNAFYQNTINRIRKLDGDLYALSSDRRSGLSIFKLSGDSLYYLKTVLPDKILSGIRNFPFWEIRNKKLFLFNGAIYSYDYSDSDTNFVSGRLLLSDVDYPHSFSLDRISYNCGIDRNLKYAAKIFKGPQNLSRDTLKILDIDKGQFISTIILNNVKEPFLPVIDSPYVYVHQVIYKYTGVDEINSTVLKDFKLSVFPNPFNPSTSIKYSLPNLSLVELKIYDALGQEMATLVNKVQSPGEYTVRFNASFLPSGIYLCRIQAGEYRKVTKLLLLK